MITAIIRDLILVFVSTFRAYFGYIPHEFSYTVSDPFAHVSYIIGEHAISLHVFYYDDPSFCKRNNLTVSIYNNRFTEEIKTFKSTSITGHIQNIGEAIRWLKRH